MRTCIDSVKYCVRNVSESECRYLHLLYTLERLEETKLIIIIIIILAI